MISKHLQKAAWGRFSAKQRLNLVEQSQVLFHSHRVCLHGDQSVARVSGELQIMCEHERLTTPHSRSAGFDARMGSWYSTSLGCQRKGCGLWQSAALLCGWEQTPVSSATQKQQNGSGISPTSPTPWPPAQSSNGACRLRPKHHF